MLIDGVCPTCPAQAPAPAPQPSRPAPAAARHAPAASVALVVHQQPPGPETPRPWFSSVPTPPEPSRGKGWRYAHRWNWGAFLLCPLWLMNHGRIWRGILCLVFSAVPYFWVFALGMAIAYGIKGNKVASMSRDFVDDAQFVAVQNAWRDAGFGVVLAAVVLSLVVGYANVTSVPQRR